jgi:sodium/pantothenate symporter
MTNITSLIPAFIFLVVAVAMSVVIRQRRLAHAKGKDFESEYYIGSRSLGGFVLALTTVATYGSVSSFVGGPGQAWSIGWGWVYMACVQVTALILLYGLVGKKLALVSRKIDAITIVDVIRHRYQSNALAILSSCIIIVFFVATMIAQFVGGAKIFEAVTGYSYTTGMILFGLTAIIFTTIGGFRGVAFTDVLCGIMMIVGLVVLAAGILYAGGGYENIMATIQANHPEMMEPLSGGDMPLTLYFTQWLLVGIFTFCLPQSAVRCIGAKNVKSMHRAMIIGTVVIGFMMIVSTSLGVLSAGILTQDLSSYGGSVDNIIPLAIVNTLGPVLAGVAIIGPIAASISTVSSLLIVCTSSLVRDIFGHIGKAPNEAPRQPKNAAFASQLITLVIGIIVFVLSLVPPSVIWKINMFAFGGLETAFCWVLVMGLFWKRANKVGALLSMAGGALAYCVCMYFGIKFFGMHQIVIGIVVALVLMIAGSLFADKFAAFKNVDHTHLDEYFW